MSRSTSKGLAPTKLPAGPLSSITIGMQTIVVPQAIGHKLLPLLEKGFLAERGYTSRRYDDLYLHAAVRAEYTLLSPEQVHIGERPGREEGES